MFGSSMFQSMKWRSRGNGDIHCSHKDIYGLLHRQPTCTSSLINLGNLCCWILTAAQRKRPSLTAVCYLFHLTATAIALNSSWSHGTTTGTRHTKKSALVMAVNHWVSELNHNHDHDHPFNHPGEPGKMPFEHRSFLPYHRHIDSSSFNLLSWCLPMMTISALKCLVDPSVQVPKYSSSQGAKYLGTVPQPNSNILSDCYIVDGIGYVESGLMTHLTIWLKAELLPYISGILTTGERGGTSCRIFLAAVKKGDWWRNGEVWEDWEDWLTGKEN